MDGPTAELVDRQMDKWMARTSFKEMTFADLSLKLREEKHRDSSFQSHLPFGCRLSHVHASSDIMVDNTDFIYLCVHESRNAFLPWCRWQESMPLTLVLELTV